MAHESLKPLLIGGIFSAVHFLSPLVARHRERLEPHLSSLAGGFASAFVFLELLPSVDTYHEVVGPRIYGLILVGFAAFYGIECYAQRRHGEESVERTDYLVGMILALLYNLLLAMGMTHELPGTLPLTLLFSALMSFHLLSTDLGLIEENASRFKKLGRFGLILAIFAGLGLSELGRGNERTMDIVAAATVGVMLYRVLRHELPEFRRAHFRSFVAGAAFFALMHFFLTPERLEESARERPEAGASREVAP